MESKTNFTLGRNLQLVLLLLHPHKFKNIFKFLVLQVRGLSRIGKHVTGFLPFVFIGNLSNAIAASKFMKKNSVTAELVKDFFHDFLHFS